MWRGLIGADHSRPPIRLGSKPRLLYGTAVGTLLAFMTFMWYYNSLSSGSGDVWVWFGMRSDGRCGRDFGTDHAKETTCGGSECCSSHGWCGKGDEYCSVALGCQSNCYAESDEKVHEHDEAERQQHRATHAADDDMEHMHDYKYDDAPHGDSEHDNFVGDEYRHDDNYYPPGGRYGHGHDYGHDYHHDHHDYHHKYDEDPDEHHHGRWAGDEDVHDSMHAKHDSDDHYGEAELGSEGGHEGGGPELVGLEEKRHLGEGDGVPLEGGEK